MGTVKFQVIIFMASILFTLTTQFGVLIHAMYISRLELVITSNVFLRYLMYLSLKSSLAIFYEL